MTKEKKPEVVDLNIEHTGQLVTVGNSVGLTFPKHILELCKLSKGNTVKINIEKKYVVSWLEDDKTRKNAVSRFLTSLSDDKSSISSDPLSLLSRNKAGLSYINFLAVC